MSGYLRRLAAGAMRPTSAIHPSVGSVYAARSSMGAAPLAIEEKPEPASAEERTRAQRQGSTQPGAEISPAQRNAPVTWDADEPFAVVDSSEPSAQNTAGRQQRIVSDTADAGVGKIVAARDTRVGHTLPSDDAPKHAIAAPLNADASHADYTPLVPVRAAASESGVTARQHGADPAPPAKTFAAPSLTEATRSSRQTAQHAVASREPDEIQIHIGRIEVTAVPPAPVRPAARTERKSINLDEYLKQRRGGNR